MVARARAAAALVLLPAALLAACDSVSGQPSPPLSSSPARIQVCMMEPPGGRITLGVDVTENSTSRAVEVQAVRLTKAKGMRLLDAKVMTFPSASDQSLVGARNGWPPRMSEAEADVEQQLREAPQAVGAVIPGDSTRTVALVAGVEAKAGGSSGPLEMDYTDDDGNKYTWRGPTSFKTSAKPCNGQ